MDEQFEATAKESTREVSAKGSLILHPDHQEVHLTNAALRTQGVEWTLEPGSDAVATRSDLGPPAASARPPRPLHGPVFLSARVSMLGAAAARRPNDHGR